MSYNQIAIHPWTLVVQGKSIGYKSSSNFTLVVRAYFKLWATALMRSQWGGDKVKGGEGMNHTCARGLSFDNGREKPKKIWNFNECTLSKRTLIWAHAYLSARFYERTLLECTPLERTLIWAHASKSARFLAREEGMVVGFQPPMHTYGR